MSARLAKAKGRVKAKVAPAKARARPASAAKKAPRRARSAKPRRKPSALRGAKAAAAAAREVLVGEALQARKRAYAPYSKFKVGAALRGRSGRVYTGCNVENSSYGLSLCAERVAMTKAVSEGETEFESIAVVTNSSPPSPPCGACRQFLAELALSLEVVLANTDGERRETTLSELLPHAFDKSYL